MLQNRATLKQIRFHLLSELRQIYTENESDSIARLILDHLAYPLSLTLSDPETIPPLHVITQINEIVAEIHSGKPIQYILGYTHFSDLLIKVDEDVLIPRPETEEMIEHIKNRSRGDIRRIIDLGTGSGCIALALKKRYSESEVWAADISSKALSVAARNAELNKLQVEWMEMDLLNQNEGELPYRFDLVVSNPPYVMDSERKLMAGHVTDFEPGSALFVDDGDPLIFYRAIAQFCNNYLEEDGEIWVEINEQLGEQTAALFRKEGYKIVQIIRDIHDKERYIHVKR